MRLLRFLIGLSCVAAGVVIGMLNSQAIAVDFGAFTLRSTLGVALLAAMLLGAIAGGLLLAASVILPLRQQLRRERRARPVAAPGSGES
ncbi:lipopolysaccharide assembly protein LapA domain-containing protein [Luteimonas aquatica]|uniref:lipopolysaccharide assembly protein LapA domain-containing protein n=1 Tax=Luteimonas aquatica TaxID=450364 RepID=UPI001F56665B|nr:lipopolysaccharide assembly protein LapA domain-containing protein [Luteimonas aquatica]